MRKNEKECLKLIYKDYCDTIERYSSYEDIEYDINDTIEDIEKIKSYLCDVLEEQNYNLTRSEKGFLKEMIKNFEKAIEYYYKESEDFEKDICIVETTFFDKLLKIKENFQNFLKSINVLQVEVFP